ncbi:MAG: M23 family metallopeptidase [candidate division KSB1 bacterium]|nr:M23 family metallopeptidase [candidate division KSB1 bacterium]MDZ7294022.1 M23 family metallopeptidase [candidate division KSB1 bacterium]MDZ7385817.1 M23 family metallopeptidase [candidate division KSB1 bacterium]MDZ7392710.1 M23 family metallopeptidase [candidate division KSB1 bacterium]MDZ7412072.1 M23 family metallopeptidase [candidate division KSB1 bacterium]
MRGKSIKLIFFSLGGSEVKEINLGWRHAVLLGVSAVALMGLLVAGVLAVFTDFFHDARLRSLASANMALNIKLAEMGEQIDRIQSKIVELEKTDNEMRLFVDLDTLGRGVRAAGVGGFATGLEYLTPSKDTPLATAEASKELLDELERRMQLLKTSREQIEAKWQSKQDLYNHTPSIAPVENYRVTDVFGMRRHPFTGRWGMHEGMDFAAHRGEPVYATADGVVVSVINVYRPNSGYGKEVVIDHGYGKQTRYAHLSKTLVVEGQRVFRWDVIGLLGDTGQATGPHVHYEVIVDGKPTNPRDFILE